MMLVLQLVWRSTRCSVIVGAAYVAFLGTIWAQENPQPAQIPSGPYRIAGTVVNGKDGNALTRARVTIADVKDRRTMLSVITGDEGRFEFHVPAGKYSLQGAKRGFISAAYNHHEQFSTAIVTGADLDTEDLVLKLAPNAVLTGKVLDEFGDPVDNAQIMVYREDHSGGVSRTSFFHTASTDDQGRYEVTPLDEGTYFVSARASPWYAVHPTSSAEGALSLPSQVDSSLDVAYPVTYYGDATEAEDATPIPVRAGDRLEADIHMNPVPALHLMVHVPEGSARGVNFPILQKAGFGSLQPVEITGFGNVAPGVYELTGIAPGRYTVRMQDSSGHMKELSEANLDSGGELDVSSGRATGTIKATVKIEGAANLPQQLVIALSNSQGRRNQTQVDAKGEANFSDVIPGKYDVEAGSPTQPYSVVRIVSDAGTNPGHTLNVPPSASLTLSLALVGGSVKVEGFAKRAGKPVSGAMIVLVPSHPEANRDRFRRDQSDLDGSFSLLGVVPGSYTVVAIEDGWDLDWSEPALLARYLGHGQTIDVGDRSSTPVRLAVAVEVQAK
jgi:protocatechuate 3,4-dioxygenase beta subunit